MLLCLNVADVLKEAPPLVVELTWLKYGAAMLGFGINHCVCDGIGSAEFLNSFAELATSQSRVVFGAMAKPLTPTSVIFDKGRLDETKLLALSKRTTASELPFTTFKVLSTHVWRSWARALNMMPTHILKLLFSVNMRNQVKPGMTSGFYNNAFVLGYAQISVKDLTERWLGYARMLIKRAKENVGNNYVNSVKQSRPGWGIDIVIVVKARSREG
ncbi:hypothetical protein Tsubulata_034294 [Turnera subulata]|uniref:Uncharacterized protein n=1 Tax=Turnera subulata TaxID=218843 RepID=A0A9Q0EZW7_9ROSI|nr:hypothetical protein Tsubulata_034294 [Turnera subulata]